MRKLISKGDDMLALILFFIIAVFVFKFILDVTIVVLKYQESKEKWTQVRRETSEK